jgi:hypothetical protein
MKNKIKIWLIRLFCIFVMIISLLIANKLVYDYPNSTIINGLFTGNINAACGTVAFGIIAATGLYCLVQFEIFLLSREDNFFLKK